MIRTLLSASALCALVMFASACEKKEAPAPVASEAPAAPPVPSSAALAPPAAEPVVDVATLPVEEQYEADAEKEVTAANLSTQLDQLEKEIAAP